MRLLHFYNAKFKYIIPEILVGFLESGVRLETYSDWRKLVLLLKRNDTIFASSKNGNFGGAFKHSEAGNFSILQTLMQVKSKRVAIGPPPHGINRGK